MCYARKKLNEKKIKETRDKRQETSDEGKQNYWFRDSEESLKFKISLYYLSSNQPERRHKKNK